MKANRAARLPRDDRAVAGVVAGVLMIGGLVAFLAYMNASWVPRWIEGKEATYTSELGTVFSGWADLAESQIARDQTARSFSSTFNLGVRGLPMLGTGSSSGTLAVLTGPTLNVSVGSLPVLTANGSLELTTHTAQYPNQTRRYALGAVEVTQTDGAYVDLRNLVRVDHGTQGLLSVQIQAVNVTSQDQQVGGNAEVQAIGVVTSVQTITDASSGPARVTLLADHVAGGAWRAALNRTLATSGLTGVYQSCSAAIPAGASFCFPSAAANNSATRAEIVLLDVGPGWTAQEAKIAVTITA